MNYIDLKSNSPSRETVYLFGMTRCTGGGHPNHAVFIHPFLRFTSDMCYSRFHSSDERESLRTQGN